MVQKLEEKEGVLQSSLAALEKELAVRTQALELNKRKVRGRGGDVHPGLCLSSASCASG